MLIKFDLAWIFLWYCRREIWSFRNLDWIDFVAMTNQFRNLGPIPKRFTGDITCSSHWNHWADWPRDACKGERYIQVFYQKSHALWAEPGKGLHWHILFPHYFGIWWRADGYHIAYMDIWGMKTQWCINTKLNGIFFSIW